MTNGNGKRVKSNGNGTPAPAAYFKSLTIENVKCFRGKHEIDLSDGNGKPAQWTVILGNNNTGKTTILKCLAMLEIENEIDNSNSSLKTIAFSSPRLNRIFASGIENSNQIYQIKSDFFRESVQSNYLKKGVFELVGFDKGWGFEGRLSSFGEITTYLTIYKMPQAPDIKINSFGATRKMPQKAFSETIEKNNHDSLFENADLPNIEDWLLNLFLAEKLGQPDAQKTLDLAQKILISGLLPDVQNVRLQSEKYESGFQNFVEFHTDFGWIRLRDLGYGYQSMISWVLDLVRRMVERYPNSENPLAEPAIVLVDEIDLHLHPDWQRKIIAHLTKYFPNTQFIVTAHSPLIVQSAEEVNLVILKKETDTVTIEQPKIRSFKGWTVEEILTDLMQLENQTMSKTYLDLMSQFDEALDEDDFEKGQTAFNALDNILHPLSHQRKLLKLQMTSLSQLESV